MGTTLSGPFTVDQIAEHLDGDVEGRGSISIVDLRGLSEAGPEHLAFLSNRKYRKQLKTSRAGAVLLDRHTEAEGHTVIRLDDPYSAFARVLQLFHPLTWPQPGIDERAWVAPDADVDGATVEAFAWIGPGAKVGAGSWIEVGAYVGAGVELGKDCRMMTGSVVCAGCRLGDRVWLNPGAIIGAEGFGFAPTETENVKIPQVGRAVLEDDVEVGSLSNVDRGALGDTIVRRGTKLDSFVQIAHGAEVGEGSLLAGYSTLAGTARVGKRVMMGGKSGVSNHVTLGDGSQLSANASVMRNHPAGSKLAGRPAFDRATWMRAQKVFRELPELLQRVRRLERRVAELEEGDEDS